MIYQQTFDALIWLTLSLIILGGGVIYTGNYIIGFPLTMIGGLMVGGGCITGIILYFLSSNKAEEK